MKGYYSVRDFDAVISYTPNDREIVSQIAKGLIEAGANIWFDYFNLLPGMSMIEAQMEAMQATKIILRFIGATEYSREQRAWVNYESSVAAERHLRSKEITV